MAVLFFDEHLGTYAGEFVQLFYVFIAEGYAAIRPAYAHFYHIVATLPYTVYAHIAAGLCVFWDGAVRHQLIKVRHRCRGGVIEQHEFVVLRNRIFILYFKKTTK